jgi:uncharacterized RDD family membrane protein YckC
MTPKKPGSIKKKLGPRKTYRRLVTPEGLSLVTIVASLTPRQNAVIIDWALQLLLVLICSLPLIFSKASSLTLVTFYQFTIFFIINFYFIFFELIWQGRTPGKKIYRLKVINRFGGELTTEAVLARNLTRSVEINVPLVLILSNLVNWQAYLSLLCLSWLTFTLVIPFVNVNHLRLGDIVAGTIVIETPNPILGKDLTLEEIKESQLMTNRPTSALKPFVFTPEQLSIYGNLELSALENILRHEQLYHKNLYEPSKGLEVVCRTIRSKINWPEKVPTNQIFRFLTDYYQAVRGELEKGLIMGRRKENKWSDSISTAKAKESVHKPPCS